MRHTVMALPALAFVVTTRALLAAGVVLLLTDRFAVPRRRAVGAALVAIGAATTVPALVFVLRGMRQSRGRARVCEDPRLIGATRFARKGDEIL